MCLFFSYTKLVSFVSYHFFLYRKGRSTLKVSRTLVGKNYQQSWGEKVKFTAYRFQNKINLGYFVIIQNKWLILKLQIFTTENIYSNIVINIQTWQKLSRMFFNVQIPYTRFNGFYQFLQVRRYTHRIFKHSTFSIILTWVRKSQ